MAETRRLTDLIHGHVGSLTYIPPENATAQPGTFHSSRVTAEREFIQSLCAHRNSNKDVQHLTSKSLDLQQSCTRLQKLLLRRSRPIYGRKEEFKSDGYSRLIPKPSWATRRYRNYYRRIWIATQRSRAKLAINHYLLSGK